MKTTKKRKPQWYAITEGAITGPFDSVEQAQNGKPDRYRDGWYRPTVVSEGAMTADQLRRATK